MPDLMHHLFFIDLAEWKCGLLQFYFGCINRLHCIYGYEKRFMDTDKKMVRQFFFYSFKSEVGDILFVPGVHDNIIGHAFDIQHIGHHDLFNLLIALDKKEIFCNRCIPVTFQGQEFLCTKR